MKNWVLIIFLSGLFNQAVAETACHALIGSCDYYTCISDSLKCNKSNYFTSFGNRFCRKFGQRRSLFSKQGKTFLKSVQRCLQIKMESDSEKLVCQNSKNLAAVHHVACYKVNKFCELKLSDKFRVVQIILKPVLTDSVFRKVAHNILANCHR
jgi:hypothetical protein